MTSHRHLTKLQSRAARDHWAAEVDRVYTADSLYRELTIRARNNQRAVMGHHSLLAELASQRRIRTEVWGRNWRVIEIIDVTPPLRTQEAPAGWIRHGGGLPAPPSGKGMGIDNPAPVKTTQPD